MQLNTYGYPESWPQGAPRRPKSVVSRITHEQKHDLYRRRITTRDLAKQLGVAESYLSSLFPGKETVSRDSRKQLLRARREYRLYQASLVVQKQKTTLDAARDSHISYRSMARAVQQLRGKL